MLKSNIMIFKLKTCIYYVTETPKKELDGYYNGMYSITVREQFKWTFFYIFVASMPVFLVFSQYLIVYNSN